MVNLTIKSEHQTDVSSVIPSSSKRAEINLPQISISQDNSQTFPLEITCSYQIPQRSTLIPLKPLGRGTPLIEGMPSYITRLAIAHSVPCTIMFRYLIGDLTSERFTNLESPLIPQKISVLHVHIPWYLIRSGTRACVIADALETLTSQHSLRFLTIFPYRSALIDGRISPAKGLTAWCPYCFQEWKDHNLPLYEPLIWLIEKVTLCPVHWHTLEDRCTSCNSSQKYFREIRFIGYCSKCGAWLGRPYHDPKQNRKASRTVRNGTQEEVRTRYYANIIKYRQRQEQQRRCDK